MKKIIALVAVTAVAACAQPEAPAEPEATEEVVEVMAADGGHAYGTFNVTLPDGTVIVDEVREDGTYTTTMPDGSTENGTWVQNPNEYCSTPDGEDAVETCYAESIDENGAWIATGPDGNSATVERVVEEAATE